MPNSTDIQQSIQKQANFWSKPSLEAHLSYYINLHDELKRLEESLIIEQQALPIVQKYFVEMTAYVGNLHLQKESMQTFLENKEKHEWLTHILRFSMIMERVFASLAKPWSIAERTVNLSLDPKKPLLCDVYSDMPELQNLYDAVQAIIAPRDQISAEQQSVIDFAKKVSAHYTHFLSMRVALKKFVTEPEANELVAWGKAKWNELGAKLNDTYKEYEANLPALLERTRSVSSQVCGKRNAVAYTVRVNEAQFEKMTASHGSLKGLEAKIVEQERVLASAGKQCEARAQTVNTLKSDIAELQLRLDCASGRKPVYTIQTNHFSASAA